MEKLIENLKKNFPESSTTTLRGWIREGRIEIEGKIVSHANQSVSAETKPNLLPKKQFITHGLTILYEDKDLIVLEKPYGLLSVATEKGTQPSVHEVLKKRKTPGRVYPVHRLDRDTSGVMMFAYTEKARDHLKTQFEEHSVERLYIGLVEGCPPEREGTWQSFLQENKNLEVYSAPTGKKAITHYRILQAGPNTSLLEFRLETGRKNQIRVHASEAGLPIVGDKKYGSSTPHQKRLCLHAEHLAFTHPETSKRLSFSSPRPNRSFSVY